MATTGLHQVRAQPATNQQLLKVDEARVLTAEEATDWFHKKNAWGPTYTGSPAWLSFMEFIENKLLSYGAVDVVKNRFPYERWYTTEYPDKTGWSLISDGKSIEVATYDTQSGSTGPDGVTAAMILYDMSLPETERPTIDTLAGKIVVIKQKPYAGEGTTGGYTDYEYRTNSDTFLKPGVFIDPSYEGGYRNRQQFGAMGDVIEKVLTPSKAVGHVTILQMPPGAAQAGRQHSTPSRYENPGVSLDAKHGAAVVEDARAGKTATLRLDAHVEKDATAYQLAAILPGKNYGKDSDRAVMMATHTDGPGLIQDSGAFGILGVVDYFSKIPQSERPMSIYVYFDCRHFVPGTEGGVPYNYVEEHLPALSKYIIGGVLMEHIGGVQMHDVGDDYLPTGKAMTTYINTFGNDLLVETAIKAVKHSGLERAQVNVGKMIGDTVLGRPGVNGGTQNDWKGSNFAKYLEAMGGLPSWHITGDWPSSGYQAIPGIDRFSADVFERQVKTAIPLVAALMMEDLVALNPDWGKLEIALENAPDKDFVDAKSASMTKETLVADSKAIFAQVKTEAYSRAEEMLDKLLNRVTTELTGSSAKKVIALIVSAKSRLKVAG